MSSYMVIRLSAMQTTRRLWIIFAPFQSSNMIPGFQIMFFKIINFKKVKNLLGSILKSKP